MRSQRQAADSIVFAIGTNSVFLEPVTKTQLETGDPKLRREQSRNPTVRTFLTAALRASIR